MRCAGQWLRYGDVDGRSLARGIAGLEWRIAVLLIFSSPTGLPDN